MVLVGMDSIRLFYDRDCSGDIVLPIEGLVVAKDNPHNILDSVDTHRVVPHLVFVVGMFYRRRDEETDVTVFLPKFGVHHSQL